MPAQKRANTKQGFFTYLWNEFLFAREFEYETPLTPDEVMQHLNQLEGDSYYAWGHWSMIDHKVSYEPTGDKEGTFRIVLEKRKVDDWDEDDTVQETHGTLTVDADTGMTIVKGYIRFNVRQYSIIFWVILINVWIYFNSSLSWVLWIIIFVAASVWYNLYEERNKLSDRIDTLIMEAKAQDSTQRIANDQDNNSQEHLAEMDENIYETTRASYKAP